MQLTRVGLQSDSWGGKGHFATRIMSTKWGHQINKKYFPSFSWQSVKHNFLPPACLRAWSVTQLCPPFRDPMDCTLPGFFVHGILQARILEWVARLSSRGSSWPRDRTPISSVSCIAGRFFTHWATWESPTSCILTLKSVGLEGLLLISFCLFLIIIM